MIVFLEDPEAWSLMMLVSAVAIDNADISEDGKAAIRRWRSAHPETSPETSQITDEINKAINARVDAKFMRRIKTTGGRADTVKK
jgi:hypothetical protein